MTSNDRRFVDRVNELLERTRSGIHDPLRIHSGTIGRQGNQLLWCLGVTLPNQSVTTVHAPIPDNTAYLEETAQDIAIRLIDWMEKNGKIIMSLDKFTLSIELGNAAMQTKGDVARALKKIAETIARDADDNRADKHGVMDENGNSCGFWSFE